MLRKLFTALSIVIVSTGLLNAQNEAAIKIKLIDKNTKETIPFANVIVELGGIQAGLGTTNMDGEVTIKPLNPGKYNVKGSYVGYQPSVINNVVVSVGKTTYLNMEMVQGQQLDVVEIVEYAVPLIDPDTKSGGTVTREDYQNMATKNINSVASTTAGVYQQDEGSALSIRGARSDATSYYVDGQKVIGSAGVPQGGVEQVTTIIGGTPAEFGDNAGGIISITTRGPASRYSGGIELITSGMGEKNTKTMGLDAYGYNFVGFNLNGPIILKKDSATQIKKSVLGFSVSGEAVTVQDNDPSAVGFYRIKPDVLADLEQTPLRPSATGSGFVLNSEFITFDDLEKIKAKQNVRSNSLRLNGKIVYQPTTNMTITAGGSINYNKEHDFIYDYALFNPSNNSLTTQTTWRAWGKLTQKFNNASAQEEEKSSSVIKNAYFTLQAGFEKYSYKTEDDNHKFNPFNYGYIGKFQQYIAPQYSFDTLSKYVDTDGDSIQEKYTGYFQEAWNYYALTFTPSDLNSTAAAYTNQYYESFFPANGNNVQAGLGLLNGDRPQNVYSLWLNTGRQYGGYNYGENTQFRVFGNFSADIKKHAIQVGFEYEQRNQRGYNIGAIGLWTLMRQLANKQISQFDSIPILNPDLVGNYPTYDFDRLYNAQEHSQFDKSLREYLGLSETGTEWLDIDSYDPSIYSLDMFSADDLLNIGGGALVGYYGYDHTGKKTKGNPSLDDFYTKKDDKGNFTREMGAYQPIYIAGYIQDKFDFKDLKFNVGLRVDRFDANQKVLKDKYLLYETKTAGEVNYGAFATTRPQNIGDDYVVYVNDKYNATQIVGYRDGDTWYNAQGAEVSDPLASLGGSNTVDGRVNPYLLDPTSAKAKIISPNVFKDFDPQVNFMPRIAFAFPISDVANFFAHYDVLTQRPPDARNRMNPYNYLNIENEPGLFISNPNLKPQRTTDYELGFTQVLNEKKNSALTLSAFYREFRNMTQVVSVYQAYPITYNTYDNIDFGTSKGFSIAYDLRRTAGIRLNANYTLMFADGTGSSATDGVNLVSAGTPNLRTTHPLNFDQRHTVTLNADYRFGSGKDYRGPSFTKKKSQKVVNILENVGANLTLRAGSGTPYSKQSNISQEGAFGIQQRRTLEGDINGSNLPWSFRMDLRVDKSIALSFGGKKDGESKRAADLNIYLQVLNVLNNKNVVAVYRATGNPNDDGYLASKDGQDAMAGRNDPQSFTDLYSVRINQPNNYSRPRVIRLGLMLNF